MARISICEIRGEKSTFRNGGRVRVTVGVYGIEIGDSSNSGNIIKPRHGTVTLGLFLLAEASDPVHGIQL